jgi:response regulator NasT
MSAGLRIAVADDELDMRDFFERMLPRCGHQVVSVAENGAQLIEHCRQQRPDLVITDIKMPEVVGIEASTQIYQECPTPVVLVSAHHDPALIERAEADHIMAYLVKPVTFADLQPAIAVAMRRFTEVQALQKECSDLRQTLADRKIIEQAKGILMKVAAIDEKEAFRRLQETASEQNKKLVDAARTIVSLEKALAPQE